MYFRMKDSTARAMQHLETASEGVRLWVTYCQRVGVDDDFHGRFKVKIPCNVAQYRCVRVFWVTSQAFGLALSSVPMRSRSGVRTWTELAPVALR